MKPDFAIKCVTFIYYYLTNVKKKKMLKMNYMSQYLHVYMLLRYITYVIHEWKNLIGFL